MHFKSLAPYFVAAMVGLVIAGGSVRGEESAVEAYPEDPAEDSEGTASEGLDTSSIEEILITSQSRNTHDDQSISETSFSERDLKEMRIQDISDIARFTPGLEINTAFAASNPTLFIRGIGLKDYNANAAGAVPVFSDGIAINSPVGQLFQLFDVKNVTVLKGPQSGRYGRNATAGAIIIDSNLPDGEWSSEGAMTYGSYNAVEITGAIGFPIIDEKIAGRVAFTYNRRDGYTRNGCAGWDPEANGWLENSRSKLEEYYQALNPSASTVEVFRRSNGTRPTQRYVYGNSAVAAELFNLTPAAGTEPPYLQNFEQSILLLPSGQISNPKYYAANGDFVYTPTGNRFETDASADRVCVLENPGYIQNNQNSILSPGRFVAEPNRVLFEDFQNLKPWTNNVHNWAARAMFLLTPSDNVEILFNFHAGQNLGDSAHLQPIIALAGGPKEGVGEDACQDPANPCQSPTDLSGFRQKTPEGIGDALGGWNEGVAGEPTKLIPQLKESGGSGAGRSGADPYLGFYDRDGQELLDVWGASIVARWELDGVSLHSLSGYEANQRLVEDEGDATPIRVLYTDWSDSTWQVSQEFRIDGESDDFSWSAGLFALHEELDAENLFPAGLGRSWTQRFDQSLSSFGAYAGGHYDFINDRNSRPWLEMLRVSANLRLNREFKQFFLAVDVVDLKTGNQADVINADPQKATWTGLTGDFMLSWQPMNFDSQEITFHAKYARGMKNGHFNAGLTSNPDGNDPSKVASLLEAVNPEYNHALEIGFDSRWLEQRVTLSGAFYRYWYTDLQVFDLVNEAQSLPTQQLLSADANILGVEIDLQIMPTEQLLLGFGINWLDSTFADGFVVQKRQALGGQGGPKKNLNIDYSGNPTIAAPEFTLNGTAQYTFYLFDWGTVSPRIDYSYQTEIFLDPQAFELIGMPAYWYVDLRVAYMTPDEDIEVAFWMNNVTDQQYLVDVFDVTREFEEILQVWGEPRMFGVTVSFSY